MANVLFGIISRPILIPGAILSLGVWYGSYDIVLTTGRSLFGKVKHESETAKLFSLVTGVATGGAVAFVGYKMRPQLDLQQHAELSKIRSVGDAVRHLKETMRTVRKFPYQHHIATLIISGCVAGMGTFMMENYISRKKK